MDDDRWLKERENLSMWQQEKLEETADAINKLKTVFNTALKEGKISRDFIDYFWKNIVSAPLPPKIDLTTTKFEREEFLKIIEKNLDYDKNKKGPV